MAQLLGEKIKAARKEAGMTQRELAEKLNIGNTTISNWEKSVSRPSADQLSELCWALNVQPNYFLGSPQNSGDELADLLQALRERPDLRELLEAARKHPKSHVEAMADFLLQMKENQSAD